jgi:hypothetical protein
MDPYHFGVPDRIPDYDRVILEQLVEDGDHLVEIQRQLILTQSDVIRALVKQVHLIKMLVDTHRGRSTQPMTLS